MDNQPPLDRLQSATSFAPLGAPRETRSLSPKAEMTGFARRVVVAVLITVLILSVAYFLWRGAHVLLQAFAGVLFAVFLAALSDWLSKHTPLSYRWSLTVVVLALFLISGGLGYLLWNRLAFQIGELIKTLPQSLQEIKSYLMQYTWGQYLVENAPSAATSLSEVSPFTQVTGFVSWMAAFLEAGIVILIVGIFGAAEPDLYKEGLLYLVPPRHRLRANESVDAIAFNLRHWLVGQMLLMIILGLTTWAGLMLIGVPLALTLAVLAGVLELIPYVGPWISAVPAALIALLNGPECLLYTLALYLFLHLLEGYILLPLIQRQSVHLPPALTLVAQVLMWEMFGILGLFVAAPLTVAAMVLLKMLYVEDTLGDDAVNVPGEPGNETKSMSKPAGAGV
ncbi:MAG: AI-2E family transporter [Gemmataceae bacterium]